MFDWLLGAMAHLFGGALGIRAQEHEHSGRFALIFGWTALALVAIGMVIILITM